MKRPALSDWFSRIGLAAVLLLVLVPTAGRVLQASAADAFASVAQDDGRGGHAWHGHHVAHGAGEGKRQAPRPQPLPADGPDCDYCPLLASMAGVAQPVFQLQPVGAVPASLSPRAAPRLRWLHPNGLGSRGPPLRG